ALIIIPSLAEKYDRNVTILGQRTAILIKYFKNQMVKLFATLSLLSPKNEDSASRNCVVRVSCTGLMPVREREISRL
ncbi:MAG: hypothetical protein ACK5QI_04965, partial [Alphaproteobacteria bacterium]